MKRTHHHLAGVVLLALLTAPTALADETQTAEQGSDTCAATTAPQVVYDTHVEYGAFGFMKMEFPRRGEVFASEKETEPKVVKCDAASTGPCDGPTEKLIVQKRPPKPKVKPKRYSFLDLGIVSVFRHYRQGEDHYSQEWLDVPFVTTYAREKNGPRSSTRFIDVPLASVVKHADDRGNANTSVISVPFVKGFVRRTTRSGDDHWTLLQIPFIYFARNESSRDSGHFTFLRAPFFYLFRTDRRQDGATRMHFLRLPLIGPIITI